MRYCAISTSDNKFDPFEQFEAWRKYDDFMGYHTCEYLARIARVSDSLSKQEYQSEIERAIDDIIKYNGIINAEDNVYYIKVSRDFKD